MSPESGEYVLLRDGRRVLIRPLVPADRPQVEALFARLSPESRALRFHSAGLRMTPAMLDLITSGHVLVAEREGRLVALASYARLRDPARAEMAIAVDDAEHGRGVGTTLFEYLSRDARREGIQALLAVVLAENRGMLALLQGLGFHLSRRVAGNVVEVVVELRPDPSYLAHADARLHVASSASLEPLFHPRAVVVVGASRRPDALGGALMRNLLAGGFGGAVYPVNQQAASVAAVRAYPSVAAIPEPVDLAVLTVPAPAVLDAARDALDAGVRGLIVLSAGFAESGDEGRRRQDELLRLCRERSARLIGPNCMGLLVNDPEGGLNASLAPRALPHGHVALSAQSGALGIAIVDYVQQQGLGLSAFISLGNKADVSSNDVLEYWEDDPATGLILLYLESFGNPRRFARIAHRIGAHKPILAVKGGRTAPNQAPAAHTVALAGADVAVDALFRQAGVIGCDTLEELVETATFLAHQPLPAGNGVGILTNAAGLGTLCADACAANDLQVPSLSPETQAALRLLLPDGGAVTNPVDVQVTAAASTYGASLHRLLDDSAVDAVIVVVTPPLTDPVAEVAAALLAACTSGPAKPVLTCFLGLQGVPEALRGTTVIPSYAFPEAAARALGHAAARAAWLRRPAGETPALSGIEADAARALVERALQREQQPWLEPDEVTRLLRAYGIPLPDYRLARSPEEAADACRRLGTPVAVKLVSHAVIHKSDVGGVHLGVDTPDEAAAAYRAIAATLAAHGLQAVMDGAIVQPMVADGVECLVGMVADPLFGPLIAFGFGGVAAEVLGDVAFRIHPLTDLDAEELIDDVRAARLLRGYRGRPPADVAALRDLLLRVSQLVEDNPQVRAIDINPVMVRGEGLGAVALDARVRLDRDT